MDIGIVIPTNEHGPLPELIGQIRAAADARLGSVWLPHSTGFDALTAIALAGSEIPGIRLGTAITPMQTAHPSRVAAQARTVNAAIDGRLTLGVGVSHQYAIERRWGLQWHPPARYAREYLSILKPLIEGDDVAEQGEFLSTRLCLTDEGRGGVPVLLAALQPRMLGIAGELADGTITWCCGVQTIRDRIAPTISQAAADAGRPAPQVVVALPVCVTDDVAAGRAAADAQLDGYGALPVYRAVLDEAGASTPGDISIVGDERSVSEQLAELSAAGCTTFAAIRCGSVADRTRTLELLGGLATGSP